MIKNLTINHWMNNSKMNRPFLWNSKELLISMSAYIGLQIWLFAIVTTVLSLNIWTLLPFSFACNFTLVSLKISVAEWVQSSGPLRWGIKGFTVSCFVALLGSSACLSSCPLPVGPFLLYLSLMWSLLIPPPLFFFGQSYSVPNICYGLKGLLPGNRSSFQATV